MLNLNVNLESMTQEQLLTLVRQQQEQMAKLVEEKTSRIYFKVSIKGAVSVYGLGRMPLTLYPTGWDMLLGKADALKQFVEEHRATCKTQSDLYEQVETEGTQRGYKDTKLSAFVTEKLKDMGNPYVTESAIKYAAKANQ